MLQTILKTRKYIQSCHFTKGKGTITSEEVIEDLILFVSRERCVWQDHNRSMLNFRCMLISLHLRTILEKYQKKKKICGGGYEEPLAKSIAEEVD